MLEQYMQSGQESWKKLVARYQQSHAGKSAWQIINSFIPFFLSWYAMYRSLEVGYWLTLLLALPTAGFLVRIFIIQHDCGHGSFFKSKLASTITGVACSVITLTPYHYWRKSHNIHHSTTGKLNDRGIGDVYTMTVNEYLGKSKWGRFLYRVYRNPLFLFVVVPTLLFVVLYRFPMSRSKLMRKAEPSIYLTTLLIALVAGSIIWFTGWEAFLLVQLPVTTIASTTGMWLFYVQHQFTDTYWASDDSWDFTLAALQGSSYYKLPAVLRWFTGNIGYHHIHHLSPRIPNYLLPKCHNDNPGLQQAVQLTILSSIKSMQLSLWDESQKKLVSFRYLKRMLRGEGQPA